MAQKAQVSDLKADLVYKKVGDTDITMDLMLPLRKNKGGAPLFPKGTPVVFFLHGGGWRHGSRYLSSGDVKFFSDNGIAVAAVTYRFAENNGNTIADCVADCFDAARYLSKRAGEYGLNPDCFLAYGHSAGGHLTLMMLLADPDQFKGADELADAKFKFVGGVADAPPCTFVDLEAWPTGWGKSDENYAGAFGGARDQTRELARKVSPYYWLKKESPRTLIIHGQDDPVVPFQQSLLLEKKAKELGADVTLFGIPNADHAYRGEHMPLLGGLRAQITWNNLLDMARESVVEKAKKAE